MSCPICDKPADAEYRPFCSKHCANVDLAKWLNGSYAIPSAMTDEEDGVSSDSESGQASLH